MSPLEDLKVRPLTGEDLQHVIRIDEKILGEKRSEYWARKLEAFNRKHPEISLVAEFKGQIVGYILGDISGWEFGVPDTIGWIEAIGIDADFEKKGVASALAFQLINNLKTVGVKRIYTLVNWNDWDLLQFFRSIGFTRGDMLNLELKI